MYGVWLYAMTFVVWTSHVFATLRNTNRRVSFSIETWTMISHSKWMWVIGLYCYQLSSHTPSCATHYSASASPIIIYRDRVGHKAIGYRVCECVSMCAADMCRCRAVNASLLLSLFLLRSNCAIHVCCLYNEIGEIRCDLLLHFSAIIKWFLLNCYQFAGFDFPFFSVLHFPFVVLTVESQHTIITSRRWSTWTTQCECDMSFVHLRFTIRSI